MYKLRCTFVMLFVVCGCSEQPAQQTATTQQQNQIDLVAAFIDEKDPWTKYYNAWEFVRTQTEKSEVRQYENPVFLKLTMAETATGWSVIEAIRRQSNTADEDTIKIEIVTFAQAMPWAPAKSMSWHKMGASAGDTNMVEWRWLDKSNSESQTIQLWFRMKSRETFVGT